VVELVLESRPAVIGFVIGDNLDDAVTSRPRSSQHSSLTIRRPSRPEASVRGTWPARSR
jgi:hypothetical protein